MYDKRNYAIIHDIDILTGFINNLPELEENEIYYICLFARKKYCQDLVKSSDKTQLKRFTSNKHRMIDKIKQLQCEVGTYKIKDRVVPQEALVLYINPNPRCMKKATFALMKKSVDIVQNNNKGFNIHAEALSCIQKSKAKSHFVDFDIDTKDIDLSLMKNILPQDCYEILETRGGYHILVKPDVAPKTQWYKQITETFNVDQTGDQLIPVPGCYQGGFIPRFIQ